MVLPSGTRAGFFMGDAAGVGKGRQVSLFFRVIWEFKKSGQKGFTSQLSPYNNDFGERHLKIISVKKFQNVSSMDTGTHSRLEGNELLTIIVISFVHCCLYLYLFLCRLFQC